MLTEGLGLVVKAATKIENEKLRGSVNRNLLLDTSAHTSLIPALTPSFENYTHCCLIAWSPRRSRPSDSCQLPLKARLSLGIKAPLSQLRNYCARSLRCRTLHSILGISRCLLLDWICKRVRFMGFSAVTDCH